MVSIDMSTAPRRDRRIERTQQALLHALLALLAEEPWDDIAVLDVCERAGIGRSTFYLHYPHKEALLAAGLDGLRARLREHAAASLPGKPFGFLDGLVAHVEEQRRIFQSIIGRRSGHAVQRAFREMIEQLVKEDLAARALPARERELKARFVAGGIVETLALWVDAPRGQGAPEIAAWLRAASGEAEGDTPG
jgi:AcrR family transcriptional regulator